MKSELSSVVVALNQTNMNQICRIVRYMRPVQINRGLAQISNLGGVTVVFDMNYTTRKVEIRFSICHVEDNFNKKLGIEHALASDCMVYSLDRYQDLADASSGFIFALIQILNVKYVSGTLTDRERTLLYAMPRI